MNNDEPIKNAADDEFIIRALAGNNLLCCMQTSKVQTSLCNCKVCLAPLIFNICKVEKLNLLRAKSGLQIKVYIGKLFSLFCIQNICCMYSKEPSHPKHMFKLMGKKLITISCL